MVRESTQCRYWFRLPLVNSSVERYPYSSNRTASAAAQGTRAFYAARSGVEWGTFGALNNTVPTCGATPSTPTTNTFNLAVTGLDGFTVSVVCSYTTHKERSDTYNVYVITATATSGSFGDADYVSRTLQVSVTTPNPENGLSGPRFTAIRRFVGYP